MKIAMMVRSFLETPVPNDIAYSPATVAKVVAEGLHAAGHEVTFFGPEGTSLATHVETCSMRPFFSTMSDFDAMVSATDLFTDYRFSLADSAMAGNILDRAQAGEFDIVVFNHFESALALAPRYPTVPIAYILHDFMDGPRVETINQHSSPNQYFISISNNQRRDAPDLQYAATVYNGIDTNLFTLSEEPEDYLLFSGRITPNKGVKEAVQAAIQSNHRLLIAGNLSKQDMWYFDEHVKPYLDDKILFLSMLGREQLVKYYQKAKAVLMPTQWEEPFGLTAAEANACGTPVIAFKRGAVPEVVEDGKTGFIVDNSAEMVEAIAKVDLIDRRACNKRVFENFTKEIMVENYIQVLQKIVAQHTGSGMPGVSTSSTRAQNYAKSITRISKLLRKDSFRSPKK
ncbi:glycosyltransferase family 4 protein [Candidatus Saccharibacteria bacterium]|nr:glycosyltransferase family 4 protein [Candidatus Saccharibacteria bacterium]